MLIAVLLLIGATTVTSRYHVKELNSSQIVHSDTSDVILASFLLNEDNYRDLNPDRNHTKGTPNPAEHTIAYWNDQSIASIMERLKVTKVTTPAKNLILFLGDGMSVPTVTAARIYMGQLAGQSGEEQRLSFEKFPYTGLSKTYCVDSQVADSACSATAYLSGVKTNYNTIGVTADVKLRDWKAMQNASLHTTSILQWAQEAGKGTGIVTTCKVTDASPVGTYGHTADRYWQTDDDIRKYYPEAVGQIQDLASQLVENSPGKNMKVIMGGGREVFLPKESQDGYGFNGKRGDGKNLIEKWKSQTKSQGASSSYLTSRDELLNLDVNNTDYLMGLFHHYHMDYHLLANSSLQPTLAEMTSVAIKMMQKEANGYFLFIEGGRIDHGHHENRAHFALDETVEFHKAIQLAAEMTSEDDTLIVVTADHGHTMTINGYPYRGSDIFTNVQGTSNNISYSTLSYANGPNMNGYNEDGSQHNIALDDRANVNYTFPTIYKLKDETHEGGDVAVFARGPWAHLLVGNYEQTVIPHVMAYAARIGPAGQHYQTSAGLPTSTLTSWIVLLASLITTKLAVS